MADCRASYGSGRGLRPKPNFAERSGADSSCSRPKDRSTYEVQHWTEDRVSDIPVPQAVEELVEALKWRVVGKTDEKTVEVPQAQSVDEAVGTLVAVQRQVPMIQTVNEEEVHESADDGGPNVFGRGKFADVEFFKQMQETCNPKSEYLSPNKEKQNIPTRIPGKPEVETRKTRVDPAERVHRVQHVPGKQVWFRIEGKTRLRDIVGQVWEI